MFPGHLLEVAQRVALASELVVGVGLGHQVVAKVTQLQVRAAGHLPTQLLLLLSLELVVCARGKAKSRSKKKSKLDTASRDKPRVWGGPT